MKQILLIISTILFLSNTMFSQGDDPILFEVEDIPVHVSEFKYIYEKTNGDKADYSEASLQEYLDLYKKFKLKVKKARDMRLDTIPTLKTELEGYRKQLSNSYLIDKEVTEELIKEAYERAQKDVDISHIMVAIKQNATPQDTLAAYQKIKAVHLKLKQGTSFETLCKEVSEDKASKDKGGRLGFITAMLPNGFYNMENAAYNTRKGKFSEPVRTGAGYHIIKVNDIRDARGEMEVAHILIRATEEKGNDKEAKAKIDSLHSLLVAGMSFESLATKYSEDKMSAKNKGYIGFFAINRYERSFEDAAFALKSDDDFSKPIKSAAGWHIIKRISKKDTETYKVMKGRLQSKIKRDARYEIAKTAMIEKIKRTAKFEQFNKTIDKYINSLDESFLSYKWKAGENTTPKVLFTLGKESYTQVDFESFLTESSRMRMRLGRSGDVSSTAKSLYNDFVNQTCLAYEEAQLENKYPEFKSLMREYEEGILLFEATKMEVWDKASQDSVGLAAYFDKLKGRGKYMWEERAEVSFFSLKSEKANLLDKVMDMTKEKSTEAVLAKINKKEKVLTTRKETYERGKNEVVDAMTWEAGQLSAMEVSKRDNSLNFLKIEKILPPSEKTLDEARGYIVADYQDYLEKNWVQELAQEYKTTVNDKVFKRLVK